MSRPVVAGAGRKVGGRPNRRRGPDAWVQLPWAFSALGSLLVLAALALSERATDNSHGVQLAFGIRRQAFFDVAYYHAAGAVVLFSLLLTCLGLGMNSRRMRREGDRYSRALILLLALSAAGAARYLSWVF